MSGELNVSLLSTHASCLFKLCHLFLGIIMIFVTTIPLKHFAFAGGGEIKAGRTGEDSGGEQSQDSRRSS